METELFSAEKTPPFYILQLDSYLHDPGLNCLRYINVVEQAIHFWRKELPFNKMLSRMSYNTADNIRSTHPALKNQLSNIP